MQKYVGGTHLSVRNLANFRHILIPKFKITFNVSLTSMSETKHVQLVVITQF